ncbi:hypothetical protein BDW42DRAFT_166940, partial [Aspergillus taichungensis]
MLPVCWVPTTSLLGVSAYRWGSGHGLRALTTAHHSSGTHRDQSEDDDDRRCRETQLTVAGKAKHPPESHREKKKGRKKKDKIRMERGSKSPTPFPITIYPTYHQASLLFISPGVDLNDEDSNYRHTASRGEEGLECGWIMLYKKTTRVRVCQLARINLKVETPDRVVVCDPADKVSAKGGSVYLAGILPRLRCSGCCSLLSVVDFTRCDESTDD